MSYEKYRSIFGEKEECYENRTSASEKKSSYTIHSQNDDESFCRIKIDCCLVCDPARKKCDYIFVRCKTDDFYFIELKGVDIDWAFKQLCQTIQDFSSKLNKDKIYGRIIGSHIPRGTDAQGMQKQFQREYGKELRFKSIKLEETV